MTFSPLMGKAVRTIKPFLPKDPTVCEFGNQRNTSEYTSRNYEDISLSEKSTKQWYFDEGFSSYLALDVNTEMDAVICDLNRPVGEQGFHNRYSLVTNNGTGEHVWNQHQVFENAHNLCTLNGVMLHILPFTQWWNHGFYNYNPVLFRDLAIANRYKILIFWLGNRWGDIFDYRDMPCDGVHPFFKHQYSESLSKAVMTLRGDKYNNVSIVVAFKKLHDKPFMIPIQGKYRDAIETEELRAEYGLSSR